MMIYQQKIWNIHRYLFYLLLILLPTQLGYHFWPAWAMVLGRRVDYLSPTLYITDVIIILMLLCRLIEKVYGGWYFVYRKKNKLVFPHIPNTNTQILFVFIFLNVFFAANRMVAAFAWMKVLEMIALGFYIVRTKPKFSQIIFPLSIGALYSSVIAIIQFLLQHSIGGPLWFLGERTFTASTPGIARVDFSPLFLLRSYATFPHPNVLGGFLAIVLPLIVTQLHDKKKIFYLTTIFLGIIALVLTFSRSAWVVFVLGISYLVFRKKKKLFIPIVFLIILLLFIIGKTFGFQDESVVVREQLNTAAVSMFASSPMIGNGLGNFLVRLPDYLVSRTIYFLQPVHNIYLLVLAETGMVGFLIFLRILWKAFRTEFGILNREYWKKQNQGSFIIHYSLFTILLLGLVDHYPLTLQQGQLLLTIFLSLSLIQ